MKYLMCVLFMMVYTVPFVGAEDGGRHLFILSGQSNMSGLNPDTTFTPAVNAAFGKDKVTVVKSAKSGRPIRMWYKDYQYPDKRALTAGDKQAIGSLYGDLMKAVGAATAGKTYDSVTFIWMQGERDAKELLAEVYAESFKGILAQLKADLKLEEINFVIGRISDFDMKDKKYAHWTQIRKIQVDLAEKDPNGAWVDTDDLNGGVDGVSGGLHYKKPAGYDKLGQRFAEAAIELIK